MMRVLIIDDEPVICDLMSAILSGPDCVVETCTRGADGLETARARPWDLIVTDRTLPQMSGDEIAAKIKAFDSGIKVVLMTGDLLDSEACEGRIPNVDGVLQKPFTAEKVHGIVERFRAHPTR